MFISLFLFFLGKFFKLNLNELNLKMKQSLTPHPIHNYVVSYVSAKLVALLYVSVSFLTFINLTNLVWKYIKPHSIEIIFK